MKRKWEVIIGVVGIVLCIVFLGGFSLTMTSMDEETYKVTVFPILQDGVSLGSVKDSLEAMNVLAIWFGITLLLVLILVVFATAFIWNNRYPKWAAILYLLAGLSTLIGTQFIAFPIAFLFFLVGALCMFRRVANLNKKGEVYVSHPH
ncbi:DUF4064 domain-containing protein [Niallia sp.]|uniref:DUF4064 domain-containing protein n=1 Tax=Niallia sp. TaxID=2837523 RepID=UPI0028A1C56F|nr:DUF4064 domain-containing protein [Niallia sp.]